MIIFSCSSDFALYLETILWINVILGILVLCNTRIDSITNVGPLTEFHGPLPHILNCN